MRVFAILILTLLLSGFLAAQTNQSGFISPTDSLAQTMQGEQIFYLPENGFTLYRTPNIEDTIGKLEPLIPNRKGLKPPRFRDLSQANIHLKGFKPQILSGAHLFKTFDDCLHIPFHRSENGFVKALESYNDSLWIRIDEISAKGFQLTNWMDFYGSDGMMITVPKGHSVPLLRSPYADAKILLQLDDTHFDIRVSYFDEENTDCCEGLYCYVQVVKYKVHPCFGGGYDEDNIIRKLSGWVKITDEEGKRLILHHAGGC